MKLIDRINHWAETRTQADLDALEAKFNKVLQYMIFGTICICSAAFVVAAIFNGIKAFSH